MKETLVKFAIYTLSVLASIFLFVKIGNEIFIQIAMLYEGVPERTLLPEESGLVHIGIYLLIPGTIIGAIGGWYLGEWLSGKIYQY